MTSSSDRPSIAPRSRNKTLRKELLLDAAVELFGKGGYDATTTREIADRAGCSEALVYRYFGDKNGLFREAVRTATHQDIVASEQQLSQARYESIEDFVLDLLLNFEEGVQRKGSRAGALVLREALNDRNPTPHALLPAHQQRVVAVSDAIRRFQESGQARQDVDPDHVAEMVLSMTTYLSVLMPTLYGTGRQGVADMVRTTAHVIAAGLRP